MTQLRQLAAAFLLLGMSSNAALADANSVFQIYRTGDYEGAIAAAEKEGTGETLAVAARAAFALANLSDTPCMPCLKRVETLARRSIALDMSHPDAYVYLAAAYGYQARIIGMVRAQFAHYPELAKEAIDHALSVAPNDSWSLAAMGAWHIEVVRNAGSLLARTLYGARVDTGLNYFRRAIMADPENPVIRMQFVLVLSGYDYDVYKDAVLAHLNAAATLEPRTAYERLMRERAIRLLDFARANKRAEYIALVNHYEGYS